MAHQSLENQMVQIALASGEAHSVLTGLCEIANRFPAERWSTWFSEMAADAERLLDEIDARRASERDAGSSTVDIDATTRYLKESAKPSSELRSDLAEGLGQHYRIMRVLEFDPESCRVMERTEHPKDAPTEQLVAFALCLAIRDGYWQSFRQCREPKCGILFFDHMERGRPPSRYCCKRHRDAHRKRLQRGST